MNPLKIYLESKIEESNLFIERLSKNNGHKPTIEYFRGQVTAFTQVLHKITGKPLELRRDGWYINCPLTMDEEGPFKDEIAAQQRFDQILLNNIKYLKKSNLHAF